MNPIQCKLRHASLQDDLDYAAVSYVWAEVPGIEVIDVDGHTVGIGKNLWVLLNQFRGETPLVLWVDAICINQKDDQEKSEQVAKMESIYKRASEVKIWLGLSKDARDAVMDIFNEFSTLHDIVSRIQTLHLYPSRAALPEPITIVLEGLIERFRDRPETTATPLLKFFFERQWWARVCIIQEFVLARNATFYCGDRSVTNLGFVKALTILRYMREAHLTKTMILYQHCSDNNEPITLADIYTLAKADNQIKATNPRDLVYGLLGLVSSEDRAGTPVDYTLSAGEVFALATAAIMRAYGVDSGTTITIPGVFVDTILHAGSHRGFHPEGDLDPSPTNVQDWLDEAISLIPTTPAPSRVPVPTAIDNLWQIPILDHIHSRFSDSQTRATPSDKHGYDVLLGLVTPPDDITNLAAWRLQQSETYRDNIGIGARRSFATTMGFLGLAPEGVCAGDRVCLLAGATTPFVLREAVAGMYYLVGECYVQGIMDGEWTGGEGEVVEFELC
ncbi:heterokaryon incompatibility protein-domain-containing protein [Parachaetomium inaequale]|uniref:Heterokaryon incompatibility protein-domain-containing protein n=1 Tax=Parachaetomium inaequale TaxID=2588326 RepID=A0AAN6P4A9_9PEZI|nr:heterokaryon incompatibility protein-domain-containing protein [Parachaetomium inaequale]